MSVMNSQIGPISVLVCHIHVSFFSPSVLFRKINSEQKGKELLVSNCLKTISSK